MKEKTTVCKLQSRHRFESSNLLWKLKEELSHTLKISGNWPNDLSFDIRKFTDNLQQDLTDLQSAME
jgi:hypothetical protein